MSHDRIYDIIGHVYIINDTNKLSTSIVNFQTMHILDRKIFLRHPVNVTASI